MLCVLFEDLHHICTRLIIRLRNTGCLIPPLGQRAVGAAYLEQDVEVSKPSAVALFQQCGTLKVQKLL